MGTESNFLGNSKSGNRRRFNCVREINEVCRNQLAPLSLSLSLTFRLGLKHQSDFLATGMDMPDYTDLHYLYLSAQLFFIKFRVRLVWLSFTSYLSNTYSSKIEVRLFNFYVKTLNFTLFWYFVSTNGLVIIKEDLGSEKQYHIRAYFRIMHSDLWHWEMNFSYKR